MPEQFANDAYTLLQNTANASDTSITVASSTAAGFPATGTFRIRIDNEICLVQSVSGNTWTVVRAYEPCLGSQVAVQHQQGALVTHVLTAGAIAGFSTGSVMPANPSAVIGLSPVIGVAPTFMASDSAPALSQAIAPTWIATHIFQKSAIGSSTTDSVVIQNLTASTSGQAQWSPRVRLTGTGWSAGSLQADWTIENQTSVTSPISTLVFSSNVNNAGQSPVMALTSGGGVGIGTTNPVAALEVNGSSQFDGRIYSNQSSTGALTIEQLNVRPNLFKVDTTNGTVFIGGGTSTSTSGSTTVLSVTGCLLANTAGAGTNGQQITLTAGNGQTTTGGTNPGRGGNITITAGDAGARTLLSSSQNLSGIVGGGITILTGTGAVAAATSASNTSGNSGTFVLTGDDGASCTATNTADNTAGNGGAFTITIGAGGTCNGGATANTAGASGSLAVTISPGGTASSGNVNATGGSAGSGTFTGGKGGGANVGTAGTATAKSGTTWSFKAGDGGNCTGSGGSSVCQGGGGGSLTFSAGSGGTAAGGGTNTAGSNGGIIFNMNGSAQAVVGGAFSIYTGSSPSLLYRANATGQAWFGSSPVAQQTAHAVTSGYTAGSSTAVTIDGTFTGNVGSTAYTLADIVASLKNYGLLAS